MIHAAITRSSRGSVSSPRTPPGSSRTPRNPSNRPHSSACYEPGVAINLSVNLNKVALLRNSRGARNPSPRTAGACCLDAGADGLTLHWRHDNRHTHAEDVRVLRALTRERGCELNLEGDARDELV